MSKCIYIALSTWLAHSKWSMLVLINITIKMHSTPLPKTTLYLHYLKGEIKVARQPSSKAPESYLVQVVTADINNNYY